MNFDRWESTDCSKLEFPVLFRVQFDAIAENGGITLGLSACRPSLFRVVFCCHITCFLLFLSVRQDFRLWRKSLPSRQASGKLFWDARIISGGPKHNLLCSLEHEFAFRQIIGAGETFGFRGVHPMPLQTMTGPVAKLPVRICVINS